MAHIEELRHKQEEFNVFWQDKKKEIDKAEKDRIEFLRKFPIEKILHLKPEEYVIGLTSTGNTDTFCYWLEQRLQKLGIMGVSSSNIYDIYYSPQNKQYCFDIRRKLGNTKEEVFENVKKLIFELIDAGKKGDIDSLERNRLYSNFKGKILSTYFPDRYLNVFSKDHLKRYAFELGIDFNKNDSEIVLRQKLLAYKNGSEVMKEWDNYKFSCFLYDQLRFTKEKAQIVEELIDANRIEYVDLKEVLNFASTEERKNKKSRNTTPPNYDEINKNRTLKGQWAEQQVLKAEKQQLIKWGIQKEIIHQSAISNTFGYDILSFDKQGNPKHIEVKALSGDNSFYLTKHELDTAQELKNYFIYLVNKVNKTVKIAQLDKQQIEKLVLEPQIYKTFLE